jgi:hypothetical protein
MGLGHSVALSAAVLVLSAGCAQRSSPVKDPPGSPEATYRKFMLANLEGTEEKIRPLVVERPGLEVLWQGPYPAEVAKTARAQYRTMEIVRVTQTPKRVTLTSAAVATELALIRVGGGWRLDASPIIEYRLRARQRPAP